MKYIRLFNNHAEYMAYKNSEDYVTPNVSYCKQEIEAHFEKYVEPLETRVVATFNVKDTSEPINIVGFSKGTYYTDSFSEMEIDGVVQNEVVNSYQFTTTGEHTIKYTLSDLTTIPEKSFCDLDNLTTIVIPYGVTLIDVNAFYHCYNLTSVTIPDSVTTLEGNAFISCTSLTSVTIPDSVTTLGAAFQQCTGLTSVICLPITPPTVNTITFSYSTCPIYVPDVSVDAYKTTGNWTTYASRIQPLSSVA